MKLSLSNGRRVMMGVSFVPPDDDIIAMADSPELLEQAAKERPGEELSQELVDQVVGIKVQPVATLTVTTDDETVESIVRMNKDELRRFITDARSIYDSMDKSAELADKTWSRYRKKLREEMAREPS